jgi:hypothetical protein
MRKRVVGNNIAGHRKGVEIRIQSRIESAGAIILAGIMTREMNVAAKATATKKRSRRRRLWCKPSTRKATTNSANHLRAATVRHVSHQLFCKCND